MKWNCINREIQLGVRPLVMGIINATPDSFSDGGIYFDVKRAVDRAFEMEAEGADLIDIGGESTRPGASPVSAREEMSRVLPVIIELAGRLKIPISVDTSKSEVAREAIAVGAEIVNDVSGGEWDKQLWPVVAQTRAGYVLMHCQGRPQTMQTAPQYGDVVSEVHDWLKKTLKNAIDAGISPQSVVVDVGIGFGKTVAHNWELLRCLDCFGDFQRPLLIGVSRKSFLKKTAGERAMESATVAAQVAAAMNGASIWRVHDVASAVAASRVVEQMMVERSREVGE